MGKTEPPPPGRRRGLCTPYPGRYLWLSLISHLLSLWHAAGSSPQNNMAFLFCILSRYFSPTHRASHWPPPSPATPSHHSHPQQHPTRCLSSLEEVVAVQFPFFADASFCQMLPHPDGADQPCHRRVLIVVRCPVSAGTKPFLTPPPPSLIRTLVVGRRLPMVCVCVCVCCCVATMHLFPIPHPVHPLPSSGTISRICSLFSPGLGASRGIVSLPPLLARQNHSGQTLYMIPRLSLHYPHLRLIGTA